MGSLESNVGTWSEQCQNFNSTLSKFVDPMKNFAEQFDPEIIEFKSQELWQELI